MVVRAGYVFDLSRAELVSWLTAAYMVGGFLNLLLTLTYKIPFAGAHSITATGFLCTISAHFSFPELAGAFVLSGVLLLLAGCTGLFTKMLGHLPKSLIDALLAGLLLPYVYNMGAAGMKLPLAFIMALIGYFIIPRVIRVLPPSLWALLLGVIGLSLEIRIPPIGSAAFIAPLPVIPQFTWSGFWMISVPMALLILSNDLAVALAAVKSHQFEPPVNKVFMGSGIASIITGLCGGNAANVGGMMSALCSSPEAGPQEKRYWAAVVSSILVIGYGCFAWRIVDLLAVLPTPFVTIIAGFALLGLFVKGLKNAFSNSAGRIPALFTFLIAAFHIDGLGLSTPVWALGSGLILLKLRTFLIPIRTGKSIRNHDENRD